MRKILCLCVYLFLNHVKMAERNTNGLWSAITHNLLFIPLERGQNRRQKLTLLSLSLVPFHTHFTYRTMLICPEGIDDKKNNQNKNKY